MVLDFSPEYPRFSQPKWLGQGDIRDKTVLLCADEGLGDILQFARYLPLLAARGANIVLVVQDGLRPLLAGLPAVSQCLPFGAKAYPPFDFHCPIMSLPLAFGTTLETIPPGSYLPPLPAAPGRIASALTIVCTLVLSGPAIPSRATTATARCHLQRLCPGLTSTQPL